jgi:sterol 24-C-methyltransferase
MGGNLTHVTAFNKSESIKKTDVASTIHNYENLFDEKKGGTIEARKEAYNTMVVDFYNMVTQFYEFGWGESFHFAPRHKWESFAASIARHEMLLAHKLELKPGKIALDMGCGIGGPGRTMARFSQCKIVGLNVNDYQLSRAKLLTQQQGLSHLCSYFKADWMNMPVEDNTYDSVFHLEALEHSPDRLANFKEIFRVTKPGGLFGGYDWVITEKCDLNNPEHVRTKKAIELGNGLPDLTKPSEVLAALKEAGFEILETTDYGLTLHPDSEVPWYDSLEGKYLDIGGWKHTPAARWLTNKLVWALETVKLAPKGTLDIHTMLFNVATELIKGGQMGIFSPSYFYLARKPLNN